MWATLVLFGTLNYVCSMRLPDYIQSCSRNDPKLNECALNSARASIRQFSLGDQSQGLHPLDPVHVPEMIVYVPNENGLKVVFKHNDFTGLSDMDLKSLRFNLDKKMIFVDAVVNLDVKNLYELSGKILIVPVKSNGDGSIRLKNTTLHMKLFYEHVENDGLIYWKITKHEIKYEVEKAIFRLENLLNDKAIGDQINILLNELWREIVADVGPFICNALASAVVENLQVFLSKVPYNELMPE